MTSVLQRYHELVAAGELRPDAEQAAAAARLDALQREAIPAMPLEPGQVVQPELVAAAEGETEDACRRRT